MSSLDNFVHHEMDHLPNEVHNSKEPENVTGVLSPEAEKQFQAIKEKAIRPAMYYGENTRRPCKNGVFQDARAVENELDYREETPRG